MKAHRSHSEGRSCPAVVSNFARFRMRGMGEVLYLTLNMCQKMGDKIVPAAPSGTVADVRSVPTSTGKQVWAEFISMRDLALGQAHRQTAARLGCPLRWRRIRQSQCVQAAVRLKAHSKSGSAVLGVHGEQNHRSVRIDYRHRLAFES